MVTECAVDPQCICSECGQERPDDERVQGGMKCAYCAYGIPTAGIHEAE